MILTVIYCTISALMGIILGYKLSVFGYRRGVADGRVYQDALHQKRIMNADKEVSGYFTEEELAALAGISQRIAK